MEKSFPDVLYFANSASWFSDARMMARFSFSSVTFWWEVPLRFSSLTKPPVACYLLPCPDDKLEAPSERGRSLNKFICMTPPASLLSWNTASLGLIENKLESIFRITEAFVSVLPSACPLMVFWWGFWKIFSSPFLRSLMCTILLWYGAGKTSSSMHQLHRVVIFFSGRICQ